MSITALPHNFDPARDRASIIFPSTPGVPEDRWVPSHAAQESLALKACRGAVLGAVAAPALGLTSLGVSAGLGLMTAWGAGAVVLGVGDDAVERPNTATIVVVLSTWALGSAALAGLGVGTLMTWPLSGPLGAAVGVARALDAGNR